MNYKLTQKTHDVLDMIGYDLDRVFYSSFAQGWTIGKTQKFVALGMTKDEGLSKGFLSINPLWLLCEKNDIIPDEWVKKFLKNEGEDGKGYDLYPDFLEKSSGSTRSEYGFYSRDVQKYMRLADI